MTAEGCEPNIGASRDAGGRVSRPSSTVVMRGIRKSFGPVEVLHGVDLEVLPGEVHVLAGENGAGKSTLIKILSGAYRDFSGELVIGGWPRRFARPGDAVKAGIATIHQELSLVPSMSVADNLFLGWERTDRLGWVDFRVQVEEATRVLQEMEIDCSPGQLVSELPLSSQQSLEIARALTREATVFVLDEPTSALNEHEVEALFDRIRELRSNGKSIVYITHKMEEIYRLADRITVLRDGRPVGVADADDLPPDELVRWMVGRDLSALTRGPQERAVGNGLGVALEVDALHVAHPVVRDRFVVEDLSFAVRRGEVLGFAGLQGSGKSEVLHALFGALGRRTRADVKLNGEPYALKSPQESVEEGIVLLTNDRKSMGLAPDLSVTHSVSLASLAGFCGRSGWIRRQEEARAVRNLTRSFSLAAPSFDAPVRTLSGGNQQKVYLARCLLPKPRVLLLDEPTRGIDVGAKADIYALMRTWTRLGIAILLITSEMDELLALSDRVLVMHSGKLSAELSGRAATKDAVLAAAMGQTATESGKGANEH